MADHAKHPCNAGGDAPVTGHCRPSPWFWPRRCTLCLAWQARAICLRCLSTHAPWRKRCLQCGRLWLGSNDHDTGLTAAPVCAACRKHPPAFDRTVVLADYAFPWNGVITALKFHQQPELAPAMAQPLAERVKAEMALGMPRPDRLLPVPLSRRRLTERGYNQAWQLARSLAGHLALPACADTLVRTQDGAHQVGAGRAERRANLTGAFKLAPARHSNLAGATVALVDDVMTTSATADAAARVLRLAGARSVMVWVVARTPEPD